MYRALLVGQSSHTIIYCNIMRNPVFICVPHLSTNTIYLKNTSWLQAINLCIQIYTLVKKTFDTKHASSIH